MYFSNIDLRYFFYIFAHNLNILLIIFFVKIISLVKTREKLLQTRIKLKSESFCKFEKKYIKSLELNRTLVTKLGFPKILHIN